MFLVDLLRKLGILRFGVEKGTYRNAAERPTAIQMDDVFDSEKELVTRQDIQSVAGRLRGGNRDDGAA